MPRLQNITNRSENTTCESAQKIANRSENTAYKSAQQQQPQQPQQRQFQQLYSQCVKSEPPAAQHIVADSHCFTVTLEGGAPWGFRLQGGEEFEEPIRIAKVSIIQTKHG